MKGKSSPPGDILKKALPDGVREIISALNGEGRRAYVVGGSVRDVLMGREVTDWDIATEASPAEVVRIFPRVVPTGLRYGTVTVLMPSGSYEVTTLRSEEGYSDGRHPDRVAYTSDILEDLARRDFTMNSMAFDPGSEKLIDPFSGMEDIRRRVVRAVGDPLRRFGEDALRVIRAVRFAAVFEFEIEKDTFDAMRRSAESVRRLSAERIRDELCKLMEASRPSTAFEHMRRSGILEMVLPELSAAVGVSQDNEHLHDVYTHSILSCDYAARDNLALRLAALFHDLGKPARKAQAEGRTVFYGHAEVSEQMARSAMRRLRFSKATMETVCVLVANHMFNYNSRWKDSALKRLMRRVGRDNIDLLIELRRADAKAMKDLGPPAGPLEEMKSRIAKLLERDEALSVSDLEVSGRDVMETLGIGPGPKVGEVLEKLLQSVYEHPELNQRGKLIEEMKRIGGKGRWKK